MVGDIVISVAATFVGALVAGGVTFLCSRHYYSRAARDLQSEAAELRRLTTLVLRSMEEAGWAELSRDPSGKMVGLVLKGGAAIAGQGTLKATAHVVPDHEPPAASDDQGSGNERA